MINKTILTSGLALFAMFFGAGNIIYPLMLGAQAGNQIILVMLAFLIASIGIPFLGLISTSIYEGNYWDFFNRLGKIPAFIIISFLILVIGPLIGIPRAETVAYQSLKIALPAPLNQALFFNLLFCSACFLLAYRPTKTVDIIGKYLSPIKLTLFVTLIIIGIIKGHSSLKIEHDALSSIKLGLTNGYSTMDLLAAFFFCTIISKNIFMKITAQGIQDKNKIKTIFIRANILAASILCLTYIGFMLLALRHAAELKNINPTQMISVISEIVFGKWGALFIGICVTFACMVTAISLLDVSANFLHEKILQKRITQTSSLALTIIAAFIMSNIEFNKLMTFILPILEVLYPALIIYCITNIYLALNKTRYHLIRQHS